MKAISDNYTDEEVVYKSITAGIDVMIVSHTYSLQKKYYNIALSMVKSGEITEERIDNSVSRILKLKKKYNIKKKHIFEIPKIILFIKIEK